MAPELKVNYRARIWAERKSCEVMLNVSLMTVPGMTIGSKLEPISPNQRGKECCAV